MAGRPKIELDRDSVAYLLAMNFKASDIANILEVSPKTLSRRLQEWGLSKYTSISDAELEAVVRDIKAKHPNDGEVMMQAHLLSRGFMSSVHSYGKQFIMLTLSMLPSDD